MVASADFVPECLAHLNDAQTAAASYGACDGQGLFRSGPLLVLAGAGTGKTRTLAHRVAHLIVHGIDPSRILLLTFSRRAAREMTRRTKNIVRQAVADAKASPRVRALGRKKLCWAGTFHSVASRLLRRYARSVGLDAGFGIIDRSDCADLVDVARQELALARTDRRFPRKQTCLDIYSRIVNTSSGLRPAVERWFPWCLEWVDGLGKLFRRYVEIKQESCLLDYDDLLLYWQQMMAVPRLAEEVRAGFDHILVDEYQDTNKLQGSILDLLAPQGEGLTVVGDDAQSIYSFRAAEVDNILGFAERYRPPAAVIRLERSYRSVEPVLEVANTLMEESQQSCRKRLYSGMPSAQKPVYVTVESETDQSQYVVEQVLAQREAGQRLRDQAVLFRSARHSNGLEILLNQRNIPFVKYGGLKFIESAHIKDVLSVLRWADNPKHRVAAFRAVQLLPGIGPRYAERCLNFLSAHDYRLEALGGFSPPLAARHDWPPLCGLLAELRSWGQPWHGQLGRVRAWYRPHLERIHDQTAARWGDLDQLEQISGNYPSREGFVSELCLDPSIASGDLAGAPHLDEDYLTLSTVHSAKGQEWRSVFVINVSDGSFPSEFATGDASLIAEERRLLYVALTRAKTDLHLISPHRYYVTQQPKHGDRHVYGARSRFLSDRLLERFERRQYPERSAEEAARASTPVIDLAARMRSMW